MQQRTVQSNPTREHKGFGETSLTVMPERRLMVLEYDSVRYTTASLSLGLQCVFTMIFLDSWVPHENNINANKKQQ